MAWNHLWRRGSWIHQMQIPLVGNLFLVAPWTYWRWISFTVRFDQSCTFPPCTACLVDPQNPPLWAIGTLWNPFGSSSGARNRKLVRTWVLEASWTAHCHCRPTAGRLESAATFAVMSCKCLSCQEQTLKTGALKQRGSKISLERAGTKEHLAMWL